MSLRAAKAMAVLVLLAAAGGAVPAAADEGSETGFKLGNARLHTLGELSWGIDSAAGYFPTARYAAKNGLAPEWIARIRPGVRATMPTQMADLSGEAALDGVLYTGILSPGSQGASRLQGALDLSARFNPKGAFGFQVQERLARSDRTTFSGASMGVLSLRNDVKLSAPLKPGGGALEITPAVNYGLELFSAIVNKDVDGCTQENLCTSGGIPKANYHALRGELLATYRFLPKTTALLEATIDGRAYFDASVNRNTELLRTSVGLVGMLLPRFSGTLKVGWAKDFLGSTNSVIAQAEVVYLLDFQSSVRGGYQRSVEPSPGYGIVTDDRGYASINYVLGGRLRLAGNLSLDYLTFSSPLRHDLVFAVGPAAEYTLTRWMRAGLGYNFTVRTTDATNLSTLNLARHDANVRLMFDW